MAACPACDASLSEGGTACPDCGTLATFSFDSVTGTEGQAMRTATQVRKEIGLLAATGVSSTVAERLLAKADGELREGRPAQSLAHAQAARRAVAIGKTRARLQTELARAEASLRLAKEGGADTTSAETALTSAVGAFQEGRLTVVSTLLRKASVQTAEEARVRSAGSLLKSAERAIQRALERGADVSAGQAELGKAREALRAKAFDAAREAAARARDVVERSRKLSRYEKFIKGAEQTIDVARKSGATLTEAVARVADARNALKEGRFADAQTQAAAAKEAVAEAKRVHASDVLLVRAEKLARKEEKRGTDMAAPDALLKEARVALQAHAHRQVRELARETQEAIHDAVTSRRLRTALTGIAEDVAEVRTIGGNPEEAEGLLRESTAALEAQNFDQCRRLSVRSRRAVDDAREARRQEIVIDTIQRIVAAASAGGKVDPQTVRDMIQDVEAMLAGGEAVDVDAIVKARITVVDDAKLKEANHRLAEVQNMLLELKRAEIDVTGAEERIALAWEALDEGRFEDALSRIVELEEIARSLTDTLKAAAAETLTKAQDAADKAKKAGIPIPDALRILSSARTAIEGGRVYESLEFARIAQSRAELAWRRHFEEEARRDVEQMKAVAERVKHARERIDALFTDIEDLTGLQVDVAPARDSLANAQKLLHERRVDQVEAHLAATERIVEGMRGALRKSAEDALDRVRKLVAETRNHGLMTGEMEAVFTQVERAFQEDRHPDAIAATRALEDAIEHARDEKDAEVQRQEMELAKRASDRYLRVNRMIEELKKANIDIQGSTEALLEATRALQARDFEAVDTLLGDLEVTAREMRADLVAAARYLVAKAKEVVDGTERAGENVSDARRLLEAAESFVQKGRLDDAVESANTAKQRAEALLQVRSDEEAREERFRLETTRQKIDRLKLVVEDLRRADITIEGAEHAIEEAEVALAAKKYDLVHTVLAATESLAQSLQDGLKTAAETLLARSQANVDAANKAGLPVRRAGMVLMNAADAIRDRRFVEAIVYHKVIDDIVEDAKRVQNFHELEAEVHVLRADLARAAAFGGDVRKTEDLLHRAQEEVSLGRFDRVAAFNQEIRKELSVTRQQILSTRLDRARVAVGKAELIGAKVPEAAPLIAEAQLAVEAGNYETVDTLARQLEEKAERANQTFQTAKAEEDFLALEDLANRVKALGLDAPEAARFLEDARRLKDERNFDSMSQVVTEARRVLSETSRDHILAEHRRKMVGLGAMLEAAKRIGANTAEVEEILNQAEAAMRGNDLSAADMLVKQAEVSTGLNIQQFIQNKYPNLIVKLPKVGLQANTWNRLTVAVANKGTIGARNVDLKLDGDVEVRLPEPIPEIGVDETKEIEVGVKPLHDGEVPVNVRLFYNRYFDDNKYEVADTSQMKVESAGTYLVEDIFLIHLDGRLVAHESRKIRQEIDEDIFSGMLTVVQDFIRDSFKERTMTGIKRLDFGQSKILIERSPHCFLTAVVLGSEPALLPLYMAEVLREVEAKFGDILGAWSGMLHELPGVQEKIRNLLLTTEARTAARGDLSESEVAEMERLLFIAKDSGAETGEVEELLAKAQSSLETDMDLAWQLLTKAKVQAKESQGKLLDRMKALVDQTGQAVETFRGLGEDSGPVEILLKEVRGAFESGRFDRVEEVATKVRETLERAQQHSMSKQVERELSSLIQDMERDRAEGVDVTHAEAFLVRIEDALQRGNFGGVQEYLGRARESLKDERRGTILKRSREALERLGEMLVEAKGFGAASPEAEGLLLRAQEALAEGRVEDLDAIVRRAGTVAKAGVQKFLEDKYPRLFVTLPSSSLQADSWNKFVLELANKGNLAAKDVDVRITGDVEVRGLVPVPRIDPNEKKRVEIGVRPRGPGALPLDIEVHYHRPLDDRSFELADTKAVRAERPGTYLVEDAFLIHRDGRLITHESRAHREAMDEDIFSGMLTAVLNYVKEAFQRAEEGLRRLDFGKDSRILFERSPNTYLATAVLGGEPVILPLYMVDVLRDVEDQYGDRLSKWTGFLSELPGVEDLVRRLLYVTEASDADLGPLASSPLAETMRLVADAEAEDRSDFVQEARAVIETKNFAEASQFIQKAVSSFKAGREQLHEQLRDAVITHGEMTGLHLTDEQTLRFIEIVRRVVEAVFAARQNAGLDRVWPVKRVAIKVDHPDGMDAVTSFRKIVVTQSGAKELDIVAPGDTWRGLKLSVHVDSEAIARAYRRWAGKIEILLRSQDAWKIKQGIDRGEYHLGVEGQKLKIDQTMVSFTESVPDHVVEQPFEGGKVYVDTTMTDEILAEGYARELVNIIRDVRRDLKLTTEIWIETKVRASETLNKMLKNWKDFISKETNSQALKFVRGDLTDGYVVECNLGTESFSVSVKRVEAVPA